MIMTQSEQRRELLEDGYCKFPNLLSADLLARLRTVTDRVLNVQSAALTEDVRAQGSLLPTTADPLFAELIAYPPAIDALASLGFDHPTFSDGYIISKGAHSPPLFWHYDWFAWEDARSYDPLPPQLFLMYYLSDTSPENGCLRVIPGTQITHNPLHDALREPHSRELGRATDLTTVEFSTRPDEVDVTVQAGDLLIGDARLLHAAHANETDQRRTLITLWYQPDLKSLPERIQAQMAAKVQHAPSEWPEDAKAQYQSMLATYNGDAAPYARTLYQPKP